MEYMKELRALVGNRPLIVVSAGVLMLDPHDQVLLQRRGDDGSWSIPGGAMDLGETLEDTARREVREETGMEAGSLAFVTVLSGPDLFVTYPSGDQCYIVSAIYATRDVRGELTADGRETLELRYFPLDELPSNIGRTSRRALESYLARHTWPMNST